MATGVVNANPARINSIESLREALGAVNAPRPLDAVLYRGSAKTRIRQLPNGAVSIDGVFESLEAEERLEERLARCPMTLKVLAR